MLALLGRYFKIISRFVIVASADSAARKDSCDNSAGLD